MNAWLAVTLAAAFAAALLGFASLAHARPPADPVPSESHARLPWAWRAAWPAIRRLAGAFAPWVGPAQRARLRERLACAGLDPVLLPEHFLAAQVLSSAFAALPAALLARSIDGPFAWIVVPAAAAGLLAPRLALNERIARRRQAILRQLPHDLDVVTLAVQAGSNLASALGQAAHHGPPGPLRDEWQRVLRDVRAGQPRHEALRAMAARSSLPAVSNLVAALIAAERQGASLAPILRAQAEQRRTERFLRAERLAMQAPVKMLLPLVACIFPGTFAILLFPVAYRLLAEGVL